MQHMCTTSKLTDKMTDYIQHIVFYSGKHLIIHTNPLARWVLQTLATYTLLSSTDYNFKEYWSKKINSDKLLKKLVKNLN